MVSERRLIFSEKPVERGSRWFHSPLGITPHKTRVVGDGLIAATGTGIDMSAEHRGSAVQDGGKHLDMEAGSATWYCHRRMRRPPRG